MSEHLIVFPEKSTAESVAAELREEGFTEAEVVRQALAGDDDAEAAEWGVLVVEENVADPTGPVEDGLRDRFAALAEEHDGWYEPNP